LKYAFADIHSRHTERTAALAREPIQIPKKPSAFCASVKPFERKKLLTPASGSNEANKAPEVGIRSRTVGGKMLVGFQSQSVEIGLAPLQPCQAYYSIRKS
jgi:hypothetical protein